MIESAANPGVPQSQTQPAIELEGVSKLFGRFAALYDVSATFRSGRLYALLGENGAGKTTLLRIVAGLSRPTQGRLRVFGRSDLRTIGPRIGYMAHATLLYDDLTAQENLAYFQGLYASGSATTIEERLAAVGLEGVDRNRRVSQFSQGMRQRLALARAILHSPDLVLLDEPFSNVDASSISRMSELMGELRDRGKTLIVITHQLEALARVADEWITMHAGTIVGRQPTQNPSAAAIGQRGER